VPAVILPFTSIPCKEAGVAQGRSSTIRFLIVALLSALIGAGIMAVLRRPGDAGKTLEHEAVKTADEKDDKEAPEKNVVVDASVLDSELADMSRTQSLEVRVVDTTMKPVGTAAVNFAGSGVWPPRRTTSDADGLVLLDLVPGIYELEAEKGKMISGLYSPVRIMPDHGERIVLLLRKGRSLKGTIVDAISGKGVPGARISVFEREPGLLARVDRSRADGRFEIAPLADKKCNMVVHAPGYVIRRIIVKKDDDDLKIRLEKTSTISGSVLDWSAKPVKTATVFVQGTRGAQDMRAPAFRFHILEESLFNARSEPEPWDFDERADAGPVLKPLDPYTEKATGMGSVQTTDEDGKFLIRGVRPGKIRIAALHPEFGKSIERELTTSAGESVSVNLSYTVIEQRGGFSGPESEDNLGVAPVPGISKKASEEFDQQPEPPAGPGTVGIELEQSGSELIITGVESGSIAEQSGLKNGDVLLMVDNQKVTDVSAARRRMSGKAGTSLLVTIRRGSEITGIILQRDPS